MATGEGLSNETLTSLLKGYASRLEGIAHRTHAVENQMTAVKKDIDGIIGKNEDLDGKFDNLQREILKLSGDLEGIVKLFDVETILKLDRASQVTADVKKLAWAIIGAVVAGLAGIAFFFMRNGIK